MSKTEDYTQLLDKVEKITKEKKIDLSSGEDFSIAIMNLIALEEHIFFTAEKTGKSSYLDLLNEVRAMRTELLKEFWGDYEGEVWCMSKHLLAASMRLMEVGTKELKKGDKKKAEGLFKKSYQLYSLFWGINLKIIKTDAIKREDDWVSFLSEAGEKRGTSSLFDKLGALVQKAVNCCRE